MPPKRARKASVARPKSVPDTPKPTPRFSLAARNAEPSPSGSPGQQYLMRPAASSHGTGSPVSSTPPSFALQPQQNPPSPSNSSQRRDSNGGALADDASSPFSPGGYSGPSFTLDGSASASGFGDTVQSLTLGDGSESNPLLGNDAADADGVVRFDQFGVAEFVANVRVTKGRRLPVAVQEVARVKPLWKPRLLRITLSTDGLGAHRSTLEILRLKSPETGSRVTSGLIQRIFLRSLDHIQRASVIPKHALPFYIENPNLTTASAASTPAAAGAPSSPSFNERRSSTSSRAAPPAVVKEYRYGALMLRLGFTIGNNKELHDLYYDEEHLRKVARTHGVAGLMTAAKSLQDRATTASATNKRSLKDTIKAAIAKLRNTEGKLVSSPPKPATVDAAHTDDDDDDAVETIDICFRSARSRDTWYTWFNEFIIEHELQELREDNDSSLRLAAVARQHSLAAIFASVADPMSSSDVLGQSSQMFSEPGSTHFGRVDNAFTGSEDGNVAPPPPVGTLAPITVPERPLDGVAQFVAHFSSVDPERNTTSEGSKPSDGGGGGQKQAPCGGLVKKLIKNGKTEERKLLLGRKPGELIVSGGLTVRREVIDLTKSRVVVETPWTRNFIIIPDIDPEATKDDIDQLLETHKKTIAPPLEKTKDADGTTAASPPAAADAATAAAGTARKRPLIELRAARMEDREAFVEWLMKVRGTPQADHDTHLYKAAEIAAAAAQSAAALRETGMANGIPSENSFGRNSKQYFDDDDHSGSPTRSVSMTGGMHKITSSHSVNASGSIKPLSSRSSGVAAPSEGSSSSQNKGTAATTTTHFTAPSGAVRPTTWNVEHVHRRSLLSANYHGKNISGADRHDRGSSDASSSDDDDDNLPEYMIARPIVDSCEASLALGKSPSGSATPVHNVKGDALSAAAWQSEADRTDPEVYDSEERGAWCYVAFHRVDHAPTASSSFALRFVWFQAGEKQGTPDAYSNPVQQTAAKRLSSGKIVVFNAMDLAGKPCIDAAGADVIHLSRWSRVAGRAGFEIHLKTGPTQSVVVHVVPSDAKQHIRLVAYLQHRLWCPVYELQPDSSFGVTPADTPSMSAVEHRVAVMSAIDKIMGRTPPASLEQNIATLAKTRLASATAMATASSDHHSALERHFAAEVLKEVELVSEGSLPCTLCGVEHRQVEPVCRATGLFHAETIRARLRDVERGLLSSVFDALPPRKIEVGMPPAKLHGTTAALVAFNAHIEEVTSRGREAIEGADDLWRRFVDFPCA